LREMTAPVCSPSHEPSRASSLGGHNHPMTASQPKAPDYVTSSNRTEPLLNLVRELYPLHRTLVSDGTDDALERVRAHLGPGIRYDIERFPPGAGAWTWRVPKRWVVHEAYIEIEGGGRVVDFAQNPLHLVSYSDSVDVTLSWEDLAPHLHVSSARPRAIPWKYRYYEPGWGFCLSAEQRDALPHDARYRVVIDAEQRAGPRDGLAVGVATVGPTDGEEFLICAHICHPMQANDDLAGVASAVEVMRRLAADPLPEHAPGIRLLLCPETIGSVCYLSHHEDLIERLSGAVFCEMTGNDMGLALQRTRQDSHLLDRIARMALAARCESVREGAFREVVGNDEMVINGPGVDVPCVSITRWPYPEYHTSDDSPAILSEQRMSEAADVVEEIVRVYGTNYTPRRTFRGPVFLSGYDLWVDCNVDPALNHALEMIMLRLEGDRTVFDIAGELGLAYHEVLGHVERFRRHGLVERTAAR
jgi:aminopeptidase-like protein